MAKIDSETFLYDLGYYSKFYMVPPVITIDGDDIWLDNIARIRLNYKTAAIEIHAIVPRKHKTIVHEIYIPGLNKTLQVDRHPAEKALSYWLENKYWELSNE